MSHIRVTDTAGTSSANSANSLFVIVFCSPGLATDVYPRSGHKSATGPGTNTFPPLPSVRADACVLVMLDVQRARRKGLGGCSRYYGDSDVKNEEDNGELDKDFAEHCNVGCHAGGVRQGKV